MDLTSRIKVLLACVLIAGVVIGAGALLGFVLRRITGRRFSGVISSVMCFVAPTTAVILVLLHYPFVGVWDAGIGAVMFAFGVMLQAHTGLATRKQVGLVVASFAVGLLLVEIGTRLFLPPAPGYPPERGIHLFFGDTLRDGRNMSWDFRGKDLVCSISYGPEYRGALDLAQEEFVLLPDRFTPRADAKLRVLHVGDSMTFGFGVDRSAAFPALLQQLEPKAQHVNAAVPGTAPDAYYMILRGWIPRIPFDLAVMYVFEGNDLDGLGDAFPCSDWNDLLDYSSGHAAARFPHATSMDAGRAGASWLMHLSPPPYFVKALLGWSSAAAFIAAAIQSQSSNIWHHWPDHPKEVAELEMILRLATDEFKARGIPLVIVDLPERTWVEDANQPPPTEIMDIAHRAGARAINPALPMREAAMRGEKLFLPDGHYTEAGHRVIANWLHDHLYEAAGIARP